MLSVPELRRMCGGGAFLDGNASDEDMLCGGGVARGSVKGGAGAEGRWRSRCGGQG